MPPIPIPNPGTTMNTFQPSISFPSSVPNGLLADGSLELKETVAFDPAIHLQYEQPEFLVDLSFQKRPYPYDDEKEAFPGLAFTGPFRLLSEEGVKVLRGIMDNQSTNDRIRQSDNRTPLSLRGLGYISPFVRAFNRSEAMDGILSQLANDQLAAHPMPMNYSQINVGAIGGDKPVDAWHLDSVDYVLVIILSDTEGMEGGKLEVVMHPTDKALALMEERQGNFLPGETFCANYPKAGYAILMQGSKMLHHVTPVLKAKEPRISLINSYVSRNIFRENTTKYKTFEDCDPKHITPLEFARHRAWRVRGLLNHIIEEVPFPDGSDPKAAEDKKEELIGLLERASLELQQAHRLIRGQESDAIGYYDEVQKVKQVTGKLNEGVTTPKKQ